MTTSIQREAVGTASLNLAPQEALNVAGDGLHRSGFVFRSGDKVMQIKNNYDKEVFNGDIDTVQLVNIQDRSLVIDFDGRLVEYNATELDELLRVYVTTIHKAHYPVSTFIQGDIQEII